MSGNNGNGNGNGNGALAIAEAPPMGLIPVDSVRFAPDRRDWAMLDAYFRLIVEGNEPSWANIAHRIGITAQAVNKRNHKPGFRGWWEAEKALQLRPAWNTTLLQRIRLAAKDLESFRLLIPIMEPAAHAGASGDAPVNQGIVVNIHD